MPDKTTVAGELPRLPSKMIEQGWHDTFSTNNPFCPCTLKTFEKSVGWAHRHYEALATAALAQKDGEIAALRVALLQVTNILDRMGDMPDEFISPTVWRDLKCEREIGFARAALGGQA